MEHKGISTIASQVAAALLALSGCAGPSQMGPDPGFRSALLRDVGDGDSLVSGSSRSSSSGGFRLPPPTRSLESQCQLGFRHPVLNRCEFLERAPAPKPVPEGVRCEDKAGCREVLVAQARGLQGRARYQVGGREFPKDCAGFTLASLAGAGLDLDALLPVDPEDPSGVSLLHRMASERGMLHRNRVPEVGDLVFFDHTWDRNRNGRADDALTHVGIVERVDPDGTITFLHRVKRGELRYRMNLFHPEQRRDPKTGKVLNHYLRVGADDGVGRLTGQLFHDFATVFR
jgi:peptidoglycan DL-endopeptidase CwlO